jgi:hypothetical protein
MLAHDRQIGDVGYRWRTPFPAFDFDPSVPVLGHFLGIAREAVADMLILHRKGAQVAVGTVGDVYNEIPFFH